MCQPASEPGAPPGIHRHGDGEAQALDLSWTVSEGRGERELKVNLKTAEIKIGKVPVVMTCRDSCHERAGTAFAVRPDRWVTGNYFVTAGQK